MESLNSTANKSLSAADSMRALEKSIKMADQRVKMRRIGNINAQFAIFCGFIIPFGSYMIYHMFHSHGVMHNYKTSAGGYMNFAQTWMLKYRGVTHVYRPEIYYAYEHGALQVYTKKIEEKKKAGTLPEDKYYPTSWF